MCSYWRLKHSSTEPRGGSRGFLWPACCWHNPVYSFRCCRYQLVAKGRQFFQQRPQVNFDQSGCCSWYCAPRIAGPLREIGVFAPAGTSCAHLDVIWQRHELGSSKQGMTLCCSRVLLQKQTVAAHSSKLQTQCKSFQLYFAKSLNWG